MNKNNRYIMENTNFCFVIQPIRDNKYDKRYEDVFMPAIQNAGLAAYRVDKDSAVRNIIDEIEKKISMSTLCLADISIDNPNVWYELGYAFALGKDVVMVCDEERKTFPFDISHKSIIPYKTESSSDFVTLSNQITNKIKSFLASNKTSEKIIENPLKDTNGFQPYETALLAFIIGEQITDEQSVSIYMLKDQMSKAGFNDTAMSIGIRMLQRKQLIETYIDEDWNGNEFNACRLTPKGIDFILNNVDLFNVKQKDSSTSNRMLTNDLPF